MRIIPPHITLRHAKAWTEVAGIQSVRDITALDCLGVPVFVSERSPAAYPYSFGKGRVPLDAEIGAYMEAIESYFSEPGSASLQTRLGSPCDCGPILEFAPKLGKQADPVQPLLLVVAENVESGAKVWLPAELVFNPAPSDAGASLFGASSNGLASGNSVLEASIHALYELIERDIWSLEFIRNHAAWVDPADLPGDARRVAEVAALNGLRLIIRYVPNDYGLPFFAAFLCAPDRPERRLFNGGWGCHAQREVALMSAVTEAAQSRLAFRSGLCEPEKSKIPGDEAERVSRQIEAISSRTPSTRFTDIPQLPPAAGLEAEWAVAINCLRRVIERPIYRVVYTPADAPLHVVRLIVPLLEYFTPSTNRMGPRMRAALEALAARTAQPCAV